MGNLFQLIIEIGCLLIIIILFCLIIKNEIRDIKDRKTYNKLKEKCHQINKKILLKTLEEKDGKIERDD